METAKNWKNVSRETVRNRTAYGAGDAVFIRADGPLGHVSVILHSSGRVSVRFSDGGDYVTVGPVG